MSELRVELERYQVSSASQPRQVASPASAAYRASTKPAEPRRPLLSKKPSMIPMDEAEEADFSRESFDLAPMADDDELATF